MTEADEPKPEPEAPVLAPVPEAAIPEPEVEAIPLNAEGRERPRFLLAFPEDPELQRLVRAFEAGNYEAVRTGSAKLIANSEDPIVRAAARELRQRIDPDPLMKYLLGVALALFVFVVWYVYRGQPH